MSATEAEIITDLDAKAAALIGADYAALSATMKAKLWAVIAYAIFQYTGGGGGAVASVFTRVGAVVAQAGDYNAAQVGADAAGTAAAAVGVHEGAADPHPGYRLESAPLTDADVAAANKDGAVATPSMRTLGTGAQQAATGNHTHTASDVGALTHAQVLARLSLGI